MTSGFTEIPFVKSGILSAIDVRQKNSMVMYVDGHNNIGFSGGPIVYLHRKTGEYRVAAVVQGYKTELSPVLKKEDLQKTDARAYEDLYVRGNSGIVVGYSIKHIVDAIQKDSSERKGNSK